MKAKENLKTLKEKVLTGDELSDEELYKAVGGVSEIGIPYNVPQIASTQKATLHTTMNPPNFTGNCLTASSENVQLPESTYNEADMSKKQTTFSKVDILSQVESAMTAEANNISNGVLSLLQ